MQTFLDLQAAFCSVNHAWLDVLKNVSSESVKTINKVTNENGLFHIDWSC